jgi:NitT/TauT family transport system substrate-binding protein
MGSSVLVFISSLVALVASGPCLSMAQDEPVIEVSLGDVSLNKVAFLVAEDNGIYKKHGLNVHQFITPEAANRIRRSGVNVPAEFIGSEERSYKAPISVGGGSPLIVSMTADARTTERVIVATTDESARFHIIASPALNGADDLKGKRLGYSVFGSVSHLMTLAFLRIKKWSPESDISLMAEGMAYPALKDGKVDAFVGSSIYYSMAAKNGAKDLVDLSEYNIPIAGSGINVERRWLVANRDATQRFLKAMIEAYAVMKADKAVVRTALAKWYKITDTKQQDAMYAQVIDTPKKPYPAVDGIKLVMELFTYREIKRHKPTDFYDASFIKELDKSGFINEVYKN